MLNLHEVKIKNEPKEVSEIRDRILSEFADLTFEEGPHKYFRGGVELPSVSYVTHQFCRYPFDAETEAIKYAEKNGETPQYWLDQWKFKNLKATTTGTLVHEFAEGVGWLRNGHPELIPDSCKYKYVKENNWLIPTRNKEEAVLNFYREMPKDLHFVLSETKVYTKDGNKLQENNPFAGTFDLLTYYNNPNNNKNSGVVVMDWKGLPLDTPIATKNGWKNIADIHEGDYVFDKNGKPTRVLHVSEIHKNPCYKIVFDNKDEIIADCDHRWEISFPKKRMKDGVSEYVFENKVMTTREVSEYIKTLRRRLFINIPKILNSKAIECDEKDLPIDPYVFGCWLGDGNKVDGKITNMYDELWGEIENRGYQLGKDVSGGGAGLAQTRTVVGLARKLKELGCLSNKHIPNIYMFSSYNQRLDILRGMMDTDGYYNKKRRRFVMTTTQEWQADNFYALLSTLGIKATKIKCKGKCTNCKKYKDGIFDKYDITFACDFNPFLIRKCDVGTPDNSNRMYRNIINVEEVDTIETKCIEVDSETHTFCCGYNMLVTHNTNKELKKEYSRENNKFLLPPFDNLFEEPLSYYTIQLNLYSMCLADIGISPIALRIIWLKDDGTYESIPIDMLYKEEWFNKTFKQ